MASKFLSPGVFTTEIDQSFLAQGVAGIGAVVIGTAQKGPALVPVPLANFQGFLERLGNLDTLMEGPYAAKNYLANSSVMSYLRVLGHDDGLADVTPGYTIGNITGITDAQDVGSVTGSILAVVHANTTVVIAGTADQDANNFTVTIGSFSATASFLTSSANYIEKVLNTDPTRYATDNHYLYQNFKYASPAASASWAAADVSGSHATFNKNFTSGSTTWVKSNLIGGNEYNLFRFSTLGHGRATNDEVKISVQNIRPSQNEKSTPYGTFDIAVRSFYDTDARPEVLESFVGLSLDPDSRNYVCRRIGDMFEEFDTNERKFVSNGDFAPKSKLIRVEIAKNNGSPAEALPWGFRGYDKMKWAATAGLYSIPSISYTPNQLDSNGNYNGNIYWGTQFLSGGIVDRMRTFPDLSDQEVIDNVQSDTEFSLKHLSSSLATGKERYEYNTTTTNYEPIYLSASLQKFTLGMQGGFDGFDLRVEDPLDIANGADDTNLGVASLKRAVDTVSSPDFIDINLLAIPGVHNLKVTDHARLMVNGRMDAMYIMDLTGATVSECIAGLKNRELDDNYTAAYYPDVKLDDPVNNRIVRVKPSTAVLGAYAFSDRVGQQWFAPAGLNRGGLGQFGIVDVVDRLTFTDRNDLYDNRINPIASFPNEGITVFGQKTLQVADSALDRVNVRRLLIFSKKTIASAAKYLVFEPNNPATYQRFTNIVNPILEDIRQKRGLERFQVVMDTNINTPDVVDRNRMIGKIFLQPVKSAEFIDLQFIITNAGVQFGA
jgi:hypothetical protein